VSGGGTVVKIWEEGMGEELVEDKEAEEDVDVEDGKGVDGENRAWGGSEESADSEDEEGAEETESEDERAEKQRKRKKRKVNGSVARSRGPLLGSFAGLD